MHTLHLDEFADLTALAAGLGVDAPLRASRQTVALDGGASVSAICWERAAGGGREWRDGLGPRRRFLADAPAADRPCRWGEARVVYLHGLGIDAHSFDATALALGEPAVALDLPGHGRSSWRPAADYGAPATAPDVLAALDALGVDRFVLVGHSLGAITGARVAALAPERVAGLVLVDMSPDFTQRAVERIARALEQEEPFESLEQVVDRAVEARVGDDRAALLREAVHTTRVGDDGRLVRRHHFPHLPAGTTADVGVFAEAWPDLASLDVPVLLVRGDRGYVSPRLVTTFTERLPGAEVVTVTARHAVQVQAPVELAAAIRAWADWHALLH